MLVEQVYICKIVFYNPSIYNSRVCKRSLKSYIYLHPFAPKQFCTVFQGTYYVGTQRFSRSAVSETRETLGAHLTASDWIDAFKWPEVLSRFASSPVSSPNASSWARKPLGTRVGYALLLKFLKKEEKKLLWPIYSWETPEIVYTGHWWIKLGWDKVASVQQNWGQI